MHCSLAAALPFVGLTLAAPAEFPRLEHRQYTNVTAAAPSNGTASAPSNSTGTAAAGGSTTQLTFTGAGTSFSVTAPLDGSTFLVPNPISVDAIAQSGSASCSFTGVNGVKLTVLGANTGATIAPPQTIKSGSCTA